MSFAASNRSRGAARRDDSEEADRQRLVALLKQRGPLNSLQIMQADAWYSSERVSRLLQELVADGKVIKGWADHRTTYEMRAGARMMPPAPPEACNKPKRRKPGKA